jgi:hypothetical protein
VPAFLRAAGDEYGIAVTDDGGGDNEGQHGLLLGSIVAGNNNGASVIIIGLVVWSSEGFFSVLELRTVYCFQYIRGFSLTLSPG